MTTLEEYIDIMLPEVEAELQSCVETALGDGLEELNTMLSYHLGWEGEDAGPAARGKRIRPLFILETSTADAGD